MVKKLIQGIVVGLAAAAVAVGFWLAGWLFGRVICFEAAVELARRWPTYGE